MHIKLLEFINITLFIYCGRNIVHLLTKIKIAKIIERSLYLLSIFTIICLPAFSLYTPRATFGTFPLKEIEFIKINKITGNVYIPFEMGSYVSYKLYPQNLIFMDGRYEEVYPEQVFNDLLDFCNKRQGWEKVITNYPTDIILIEKSDETYNEIKTRKDLGWKEIYSGYLCGVFIKTENKKETYIEPRDNIDYYRNTLFDTNFTADIR